LLGAARTSLALKDKSGASQFYQQLLDISNSKSGRNGLKEAASFFSN
jgi:hypothetical protein